jgi:hypothetical protein
VIFISKLETTTGYFNNDLHKLLSGNQILTNPGYADFATVSEA